MDKDQFRIQIYHNRYTRGVVVTICRIILWTLIYLLLAGITAAIFADDFAIMFSPTLSEMVNGAPTAGIITASIIEVILTVIYYTAVIWEIVLKIRQNREIVRVENEYLKDGKAEKHEKTENTKK